MAKPDLPGSLGLDKGCPHDDEEPGVESPVSCLGPLVPLAHGLSWARGGRETPLITTETALGYGGSQWISVCLRENNKVRDTCSPETLTRRSKSHALEKEDSQRPRRNWGFKVCPAGPKAVGVHMASPRGQLICLFEGVQGTRVSVLGTQVAPVHSRLASLERAHGAVVLVG